MSIFVGTLFLHLKKPKNNHTKIDTVDLDSFCRGHSVRGLEFVADFLIFWGLIFCVRFLGVKSTAVASEDTGSHPMSSKAPVNRAYLLVNSLR